MANFVFYYWYDHENGPTLLDGLGAMLFVFLKVLGLCGVAARENRCLIFNGGVSD